MATHTIITENKPKIAENIFKPHDICGRIGEGFNKESLYDLGLAVGTEAKEKAIKTVVVATDACLSGDELSKPLKKGIASTGCNIIDIGQVPLPMFYFVTQHTEGRTGVILTENGDIADYNSLKIILQGATLVGESTQKIKQRIDDEDFITKSIGKIENIDYTEEYIGTIVDEIDIKRKLKLVVDCGNGIAAKIAPELFQALGCEVVELFCEVDGHYPHHKPDPTHADNLQDLITTVKENNADLGLAFDAAGDRLGVVDNQGNIISADQIILLLIKKVLALKPGAKVIYDVKCSRLLEEKIKELGGRPIMWKSGHAFLKSQLHTSGAVFSGEFSGRFIFNDRWFGFDDSLYASSRLLEVLAADQRKPDEIFAELPHHISTPMLKINMPDGEAAAFMEEFEQTMEFNDAKIIDIDGLRIEFKEGWALLKLTHSNQSLELRFEATNEKALIKIQKKIKRLMGDINSDIKFPF